MGILILGAGGHAKVVADILLSQAIDVLGFLDDDPAVWQTQPMGLPVLGAIDTFAAYAPTGLVLGIGSNQVRQQIVRRLGAAAAPLWISAVHPSAAVSPTVCIGKGAVVMAHTVINADARLGNHVIVNTAATIDHDCILGDYCHVAPGTHLAGGVQVGSGALIGIGAVVTPYRSIGAWATVGAGATVIRDVAAETTVVGTPARELTKPPSSQG